MSNTLPAVDASTLQGISNEELAATRAAWASQATDPDRTRGQKAAATAGVAAITLIPTYLYGMVSKYGQKLETMPEGFFPKLKAAFTEPALRVHTGVMALGAAALAIGSSIVISGKQKRRNSLEAANNVSLLDTEAQRRVDTAAQTMQSLGAITPEEAQNLRAAQASSVAQGPLSANALAAATSSEVTR